MSLGIQILFVHGIQTGDDFWMMGQVWTLETLGFIHEAPEVTHQVKSIYPILTHKAPEFCPLSDEYTMLCASEGG